MNTTTRLLEAVKEIWARYNRHPFVLGIQNGDLDREKFRYYIIQDYLYLLDYAKCFAIGLAKAGSPETARLFSRYIASLTGGEMDIHRGYMGRLGITREELEATPAALDNLSYTSYMLRVAYEGGEVEILTAILSCAYSYEVIAKNIVANNPASVRHPFYGEWVRGYASEEYAAQNTELLQMLDRLTEGYGEAQLQRLQDIFTVCSRYELAFWELPQVRE